MPEIIFANGYSYKIELDCLPKDHVPVIKAPPNFQVFVNNKNKISVYQKVNRIITYKLLECNIVSQTKTREGIVYNTDIGGSFLQNY